MDRRLLFLGVSLAVILSPLTTIAQSPVALAEAGAMKTEVLEIEVIEKKFTIGKRWDQTPGATLPKQDPQVQNTHFTDLGGHLVQRENPPAAGGDPDSGFDSSDMEAASLAAPANPTAAVGPSHIVDVAAHRMNIFDKSGTLLTLNTLANFFSNLSPPSALVSPRLFYDHFRDRFVILAVDDTHLYIGASASGDPVANWYVAKIPTFLQNFDPDGPNGPTPPGSYKATSPAVGFEPNQIYVSFVMKDANGVSSEEATTVWNIWKDSASGGFYGGGFVTINAAIRPFSHNNYYGREVPLTPVRFMGEFVEVADRGMLLLGYSGMQSGGDALLQIFWVETIGPTISKTEVLLGSIDNVGGILPTAPQNGSSARVNTGSRLIYDAVWSDGFIWLVTTINPITGVDSGEATVHWVKIRATQPLAHLVDAQDDISGNEVVPDAHTFFPSIAVNSAGKVGIGYSLSAPDLEVSSFFTFPGVQCAGVAVAPSLLRRGEDAFVFSGNPWGSYSSTSVDPANDNCFWAFNAHALTRDTSAPPGSQGRWGTAHRRFCDNPNVVFHDDFESGLTSSWCATVN